MDGGQGGARGPSAILSSQRLSGTFAAMKWKNVALRAVAAVTLVTVAQGCLSDSFRGRKPQTISVAEFGAVPDDGLNDIEAFRKAAAVVRTTPGSLFKIPPGQYLLRDEEAVKTLDDIRSGRHGHDTQRITFTPYCRYVKAIELAGARDVTIDGHGATLVYEGIMEGLTLDCCTNVTVCGLVMDHGRGCHSEGKIVAVRPGSFDAVFDKDLYPVHANMAVPRVQFWDEAANRYSAVHYYSVGSEEIAPQTLRFQRNSPLPAGNTVTLAHMFFSRPAIAVMDSRDIRIVDVTIHGGGGNAVGGERVHNLTLLRSRFIPRPGQRHSNNVDATHFNNCTGLLRMEGCRIGGQEDDAINVHCYYHGLVKRVDDFTCDARIGTSYGTHLNRLDYFTPGETVELVELDSARVVRTYRVKACESHRQDMSNLVTLDDKLPDDISHYCLAPVARYPRVELVNNEIFSHRARSFLVKSRDVLIENNTFDGATSTAIQCGAEISWREAGPVRHVVIRNNRFTHCGNGSEGRHGASAISVELDAPDRKCIVNHDVLIEGNYVDCDGTPHGIYVGNTDGVVVRNNRIAGMRSEPVKVETCSNVELGDNTRR